MLKIKSVFPEPDYLFAIPNGKNGRKKFILQTNHLSSVRIVNTSFFL